MKGLKRKAVLLSLIEKMNEEGSWSGETHIQKCAFFLQEALDVPLELDFILYKHGPYSFDLHDELTDMLFDDAVDFRPMPPFGPSYLVTDSASSILERYPKTIVRYSKEVNFIAANVSKNPVNKLERIATAFYLNKEEGIEDEHVCATRITELKPHISYEDAMEACDIVNALFENAPE